MAQLSLGESKWRMLRRALRKKQFRYDDARGMTRHDDEQFEWLVSNGFFTAVGAELFEMTARGRGAADLGIYEI